MTVDNQDVNRVPCPYCRELIVAGARKCRFCGANLGGVPTSAPARPAEEGKRKSSSSVVVIIAAIGCLVFFILPILAAIIVPNFLRARSSGSLTACQSNLKNIGTGMEMYASDNADLYPDSLDAVAPDYLRQIPTCPAAGSNTYRYESAPDYSAYTVFCQGNHHTHVRVGPDQPSYNSRTGLETMPPADHR